MGHETNIRRNLEAVSVFFTDSAFLTLLYLWSVFLMNIQPSKSIYILRAMILFTMLVISSIAITYFLHHNSIYVSPGMTLFRSIALYIMQAALCLLAIVCAAFGKF